MKDLVHARSSFLLLLAVITTVLVSFRELSDPDIGTHLRAGKWIVENRAVPETDPFTYTCSNHEYLDSHWLFQVIAYSVYRIGGYRGLSLFVFLLSMLLLWLLLRRARDAVPPVFLLSWSLFLGYICIEPRITLRPEMFTFILMSLMLLLLDQYYSAGRKRLYALPLIMLVWSNMHGLFILGFLVTGAYLLSKFLRERRLDRYFLTWTGISWLMTLVTPYTYKLLAFPFLLQTRLDPGNLFHQHIREFISFHMLDEFVFRDYLFIALFTLTFLFILLSWRKRPVHEILLPVLFFYLAWTGVRNIALYAVVAVPVFCSAGKDAVARLRPAIFPGTGRIWRKWIGLSALLLSILFFAGTGARILTSAYYPENNSYNKTGWGLDQRHLPEGAVRFLREHKLEGRIINSLSLGGWLSWGLPQKVFIDGRLEVIGEAFYEKVRTSWSGGLNRLIAEYSPDLIIYNYDKYYPWTLQLTGRGDWRLIYLDGFTAIFARTEYAPEVASLTPDELPEKLGITMADAGQRHEILTAEAPSPFSIWFKGFLSSPDYRSSDLRNMAAFLLQMNAPGAAAALLLEQVRISGGGESAAFYPLADYYRMNGDPESAGLCYRRILTNDQQNEAARQGLREIEAGKTHGALNIRENEQPDAIRYFNEGNRKFNAGDLQGAKSDYEKAIALKPDYYKAYNNLGILKASGFGDYRAAIPDFTRAIGLDPEIADAWLGRGTCRFSLNETGAACSDWKKAAELGNAKAAEMIRLHCR